MVVDVLDGAQDLDDVQRHGRGSIPAPEPLVLVDGEPAADQAVFDAEFVAMVVAEHPWGESWPSPRATPPRDGTSTPREPRPRSPGGPSAGGDRLPLDAIRGRRRRPVPRTRSPPLHRSTTTVPTRR